MALDEDARRETEMGALLHDIGKIAVPDEIINKPGPLDEDEWKIMRTHTIEGERMLQQVGGLLSNVGRVVRASHERWDGGGYPDGLAGEEIPVAAHICAACDAFNAMTTDRSYRRALPLEVAIRELRDNAGTQFAPAVVEALLAVVARETPDWQLGLAEPAQPVGRQVDHRLQRVVGVGVEPVRHVAADDLERLVLAQRGAIRALGGERLVDVGHRQHAHRQRQVVGAQPARVAAAVEALVVRARHRRQVLEAADPLEHPAREQRMLLDPGVLGVGEPGRACRGSGWRSRACRCRAAARRAAGRRAPPCRAPSAAPMLVAIRLVRSEWKYVHGDLASTIAANAVAIWSRRSASTVTTWSSGSQRVRSGSASDAQKAASLRNAPSAFTSSGSNQAPERRAATAYASSIPPAAWKISTVCARHRIRPRSGIWSPSSQRGWPWPSQCSSSARIASAVPSDRPIMRAISAPRSHRACISERVTSPSSLIASRRSSLTFGDSFGATARTDHRNAGSLSRPVGALAAALELVVVGAEQRRHPRRVRGAAGVLEQQRVEQVRPRFGVEPQLVAPAAFRSGTTAARGRAAHPP